MRQYNTCRCLPCGLCETRQHWIHADKSVSFGACGDGAARGPRQGSALSCGGCASASTSPWLWSNLERAKPSELQPSFLLPVRPSVGKEVTRIQQWSCIAVPNLLGTSAHRYSLLLEPPTV